MRVASFWAGAGARASRPGGICARMHGRKAWQWQHSGPNFALIEIFCGLASGRNAFVHRNECIRRELVSKIVRKFPRRSASRRITGDGEQSAQRRPISLHRSVALDPKYVAHAPSYLRYCGRAGQTAAIAALDPQQKRRSIQSTDSPYIARTSPLRNPACRRSGRGSRRGSCCSRHKRPRPSAAARAGSADRFAKDD
jgi:hypothetical protein